MNESCLPLRIPWKPKECIFTICVGVETPAGGLASHSNGDILEQKNNHTPY
jgi:hypothetical protein